jgi:hypothetical protein
VEATKTCPDCAETVKEAALVCRYCGYRFGEAQVPPGGPEEARVAAKDDTAPQSYPAAASGGILASAALIGSLFLPWYDINAAEDESLVEPSLDALNAWEALNVLDVVIAASASVAALLALGLIVASVSKEGTGLLIGLFGVLAMASALYRFFEMPGDLPRVPEHLFDGRQPLEAEPALGSLIAVACATALGAIGAFVISKEERRGAN